ncbi:hypothetical protein ACT6QH_13535 [Xanthobacter sp. TB0139]|uniref:hypothetical protein n=1 Tax=Xanthobacter sp. TB0139 TaxID=3459178 RepID=UPI0040393194
MTNNPFFPNMAKAWNPGAWNTDALNSNAFSPAAWNAGMPAAGWPMTMWKNLYFDCPVAVASHFQSFLGRRAQEQMQFFSELSREQNAANMLTKEMSYFQQAAMAWNTEMMELAELVQSKISSSAQLPAATGKNQA